MSTTPLKKATRTLPRRSLWPAQRQQVIEPSEKLRAQITNMVKQHEDYVVRPDGVDERLYMVVNDFTEGVWLCAHHGECDMFAFTRLQRLA